MAELLTDVELERASQIAQWAIDNPIRAYFISPDYVLSLITEIKSLRAKLNRYAPPELTEEAANVAPVRYVYSNFGKLRPEEPEKCECCENGRKCRCDVRDEDF